MPSAFDRLIADIEHEAHAEGPQAVAELEQLRHEFSRASCGIGGSTGNNSGNKLRKTQERSEAETPVNTGSIN